MPSVSTDKPRVPLPLPGDVDLVDLPHIPLFDPRLTKSRAWLSAKNWRGGGPGLGFAMMNLWMAAFRSVPAGSLDDDDEMLAESARVSIEHWEAMRDKALRGWEFHGGRVWHPVVCELAWDLWQARLKARHDREIDSHRAAAKRALDKGREPPDPPGSFQDWLVRGYPATAGYQARLEAQSEAAGAGIRPGDKPKCPADKEECPADFEPKQRKGKDIPPYIPPAAPADTADGKERAPPARHGGKDGQWFPREYARLQCEFGPMAGTMQASTQRAGISARFSFVQTFRGCWIHRAPNGRVAIVVPSKARADAIWRDHQQWISHYWPDLVVRHAKVDELRARKARGA